MKKFLVLLLAACMMLPLFASAESLVDADPEVVLDFDREAPVTDWVGTWTLAAAYIGEEYADDYDIKVNGMMAVPEGASSLRRWCISRISVSKPAGLRVAAASLRSLTRRLMPRDMLADLKIATCSEASFTIAICASVRPVVQMTAGMPLSTA